MIPANVMHDPDDLSERDINGLGLSRQLRLALVLGTASARAFRVRPVSSGASRAAGLALPPSPVTVVVNS